MTLTLEAVCQEAWRHREALSAYAYTWLKDWAQADDVVQEANLVIMKKWQDVRSLDGVHAWVRRIVQYKIMSLQKKARHEFAIGDDGLEAVAAASVAEQIDRDACAQDQRVHALQDCLKKVPERKLGVLNGYYLNGRSCDQLAEEHGSSTNGIAKLLSRLRKMLRDCTELRLREGQAE